MSGDKVAPEVGNALPLSQIPIGTVVHNIELRPGQGAKMARSAGTFAQLVSREEKFAIIKMPSGEVRRFCLHVKLPLVVLVIRTMLWNNQVKPVVHVG